MKILKNFILVVVKNLKQGNVLIKQIVIMKIEQKYIKELQPTLNCINACGYDKERKKLYQKQYRLNNKEKIKEKQRLYYEKNKIKIKQHNEKNKEKIKEYQLKNKEKIKEYYKLYYLKKNQK